MSADPKPQGFLHTMAILATAIGIGVAGAYALDLHKHTCHKCGRQWRHLGAFNVGEVEAHTCQGCGEIQWWKDIGRDGAIAKPFEETTRPKRPWEI